MAQHGPELARILGRYWLTAFPLARIELHGWRGRATGIPDAHLRRCAAQTLADEHLNAEGAALFATLAPWSLTRPLVRALVAFQTLYDYLDTITERRPGRQDTQRLHGALVYALDPAAPSDDWYAHHPFTDDGGYVASLAQTCRAGVAALPGHPAVVPSAVRLARRAGTAQSLNHDRSTARARRLEEWARADGSADFPLRWWETAAGASSSLGVFVLLALAAHAPTTVAQAREAERGYCASLAATNTLLESLVDAPDDALTGEQSFLGYYAPGQAAERLPAIAATARRAAQTLPHAERHRMILAGMVAFYLSDPQAWRPDARPTSAAVLTAVGGPTAALTRMLGVRRRLDAVRARRGRPGPLSPEAASPRVARPSSTRPEA